MMGWTVTVERDGLTLVEIGECGHLSGLPDLSPAEQDAIRSAGESLVSFIGKPRDEIPWWKNTSEGSLMGCRQSGFHFFDDGPLSRRIAAYPGSKDEQDARDRFAKDHPDHIIPF